MKTKFLIVSDIHQYEDYVMDMINEYSPDVVLDCGDHDDNFYTDKPIPWYFVHGNHENKKELENLRYDIKKYKNLHLIKPGDLITINGINIAGFGGNYSKKSFYNIGKKKGNSYTHISQEDVKAINNMTNKKKLVDILLMHESSKELWDNTPYDFGQEINSKIIKQFPNVKYVISGHYHVPASKILDNDDKHYRHEISLNTPEEYNYILLEGKNRHLAIKHMQNEKSLNQYYKNSLKNN